MRRFVLVACAAASLLGVVAGCSTLDPFSTAPKAAKPAMPGHPAPAERVAICYNRLETSVAQARVQAQQQCAKGTVAQLVASDAYLQLCPILLPTHATYACVAAPK